MTDAVALAIDERIKLQYEVEQFLYREAEILDERRYDDWLALFSIDVVYRAPTRTTREGGDDVAAEGELSIWNDDYGTLELRTKGLQVRTAWAEIPPSRTRRLVTNVRVEPLGDDRFEVRSNFVLHRCRLESVEHTFIGARHDVLERVDDSFLICKRDTLFDNVAFHTDNISIPF